MNVVIDTNVFISGIFWEGNHSSQVIDLWLRGAFTLVISREIIAEVLTTLRGFKIQLSEEEILEWEETLWALSFVVVPSKKLFVVKNDPDDDKFIDSAIEGIADVIVTQDKHLLKIREYQGVRILTPELF